MAIVPLRMLMALVHFTVRTSACTRCLEAHVDAKGLSSSLFSALAETQSGSWQTADPGLALSLSLPLRQFVCMYCIPRKRIPGFFFCVYSSMMPAKVISQYNETKQTDGNKLSCHFSRPLSGTSNLRLHTCFTHIILMCW